jgi:hypothetical protein
MAKSKKERYKSQPSMKVFNCTVNKNLLITFKGYDMVKVEPKHQPPSFKTKTDLQGGDKKWQLKHLPDSVDTSKPFKDEVTSLAIAKAGTLLPWATLTVKQVQELVDIVFGAGQYREDQTSAWCGLVRLLSYQSNLD